MLLLYWHHRKNPARSYTPSAPILSKYMQAVHSNVMHPTQLRYTHSHSDQSERTGTMDNGNYRAHRRRYCQMLSGHVTTATFLKDR